jgi:multidrug resistance efflux pump
MSEPFLSPREKLAQADQAYKAAQANYQAACDALTRFDAKHQVVLDAKLKQERSQLEKAVNATREVMEELHQAVWFCQKEEFACRQNWGRGSEAWRE